jgi:hypothetical protein
MHSLQGLRGAGCGHLDDVPPLSLLVHQRRTGSLQRLVPHSALIKRFPMVKPRLARDYGMSHSKFKIDNPFFGQTLGSYRFYF